MPSTGKRFKSYRILRLQFQLNAVSVMATEAAFRALGNFVANNFSCNERERRFAWVHAGSQANAEAARPRFKSAGAAGFNKNTQRVSRSCSRSV
jgi:hypothetical protein